jgi:hypothetical protein
MNLYSVVDHLSEIFTQNVSVSRVKFREDAIGARAASCGHGIKGIFEFPSLQWPLQPGQYGGREMGGKACREMLENSFHSLLLGRRGGGGGWLFTG